MPMQRLSKKKELREAFCPFLAQFGANDSQVARKLRVTIQAGQSMLGLNNVNATKEKKLWHQLSFISTREPRLA